MLPSEKLAIAAHLHVLLRRKTGRVTDTEWMAGNAEYAREIVRFSRQSAKDDGHLDLAEWADKLESALQLGGATAKSAPGTMPAALTATQQLSPPAEGIMRYVRGIR